MYREPDVFNCAISDFLPRNRFEEIRKYLHFAHNTNLPAGDKLAKITLFYNWLNEKFLEAF